MYISICDTAEDELETHPNVLALVVELTGEFLVDKLFTSEDIEEVWKGVEWVVMSRTESVEHVWCVDSGGGGRGRVVVAESVHGSGSCPVGVVDVKEVGSKLEV